MPGRLVVAAIALLCALPLLAEEALYQIDLVPSGKSISRGLPTLKGAQYVYREFPGGTLVSVRKSGVKSITPANSVRNPTLEQKIRTPLAWASPIRFASAEPAQPRTVQP